MSNILLTEERMVELIAKEKQLKALLTAYPELKDGQKLTPAAKRYKAAFSAFVERVDSVLSTEDFKGIFQIAYVHGFTYKGESLASDIAAARKLLGQ